VYLCIGKDIVFPELYTKAKNKPYTLLQGEKIYSHIVSAQTIDIIHWMVQTYFSSYKHVCDLFLPQGIEKKVVQKKSISDQEQSCVIFPDLWTLTQHYPVDSIKE
jgi:primosomal protein N'